MTQQEIQERNNEIATLLNWEKCLVNKLDEYGYRQCLEGFITPWENHLNEDTLNAENEINIFAIEDLRFHLDYNWIMEAVEFIRLKNWSYDMYCPNNIIEKNSDEEFECNFWDKKNPEIIGRSKTSLKEAIFIAVSNFAQKYNNKEL